MRIGYLYHFRAFPPRGGNHVHVLELIRGFKRSGCSVSVMNDPTMHDATNYEYDGTGVKQFISDIDLLYIRIDGRFMRKWVAMEECISKSGSRPVVWEINSPSNEKLAYSWLGGRTLTASGKESLVKRIKRKVQAMRQVPGILSEEQYRRQLAKQVDAAICVSSAIREYAKNELGISDTVVLPNGGPLLDMDEIQQRRIRRKQKGFSVLYSGSAIFPWQGIDYLSSVIALALDKAPDITFYLAVNQRTSGLPKGANVVILDHLDRDQILDAICASDVCVSLHPEYPWSKYGFHNSPMKLFEYMACMKPVIASDHGQMREIINDGKDGILTENNPQEILSKILYLKGNIEISRQIGLNAWKRVQSEFNWPCNVARTLNIFERLLRKHRPEVITKSRNL